MATNPKHGGRRKGAGRPSTYKEPTVSRGICIPESLNKAVQMQANNDNISFNRLLIDILKDHF
jgi:hypothetical protein